MRYAIGNGERGTIPIEFVDPTMIGLAAPPPPPARESESEEEGVIEQTQAEAPHEKYADLVKTFYDGITANAQHGDDASGGWNKRFLKAMGHP